MPLYAKHIGVYLIYDLISSIQIKASAQSKKIFIEYSVTYFSDNVCNSHILLFS